tara:strand:+ start:59 stop:172 length:114 start_codon:yes stop_codon:yes gene_type:complete
MFKYVTKNSNKFATTHLAGPESFEVLVNEMSQLWHYA